MSGKTSTVPPLRIASLDGVRGLAALAVLTFHVQQFGGGHIPGISAILGSLNSGVVIFFVLSGFLLYRPFVRARRDGTRPAVGRYFRHRAIRIVPAYWLALVVLSAWPGLPG